MFKVTGQYILRTMVPFTGEWSEWSEGLAVHCKLLALVYDILPSTTAVFSYATGSRNCQLTISFLLVLKQGVCYKQGVSFIAASKIYTSTNKTTIV